MVHGRELSSFDTAVLDLIESAKNAREQEIISTARASFTRDAAHDESLAMSATYLGLARQEAGALGDHMIRMDRLMVTLLGRNAVKLEKHEWAESELLREHRDVMLITPFLWETKPEHVDGAEVTHGTRFKVHGADESHPPALRAILKFLGNLE
jgi:hypothetical protein